jgi:glycine dehydrogenase subunit 1
MNNPSFCSAGPEGRAAMLAAIGLESIDDLYADIPAELRSAGLAIEPGVGEMEMLRRLRSLANSNDVELLNFCGAGVYDHFIPAAVDSLATRGEFLTAYTPYQPEAAQGSLQAIFEYQSAIVRLTGMFASNASLYDGGTALFEGVMLAVNATRRRKVVVDAGVSPIYRRIIKSYSDNLDIEYVLVPLKDGLADREAIAAALDRDTAAVVLQNPNFFGCIDELSDLVEQAHAVKALALLSSYPTALALLKTPGEMGFDIATGEGQPLGIPLSFGGPYLGYMAVSEKLVRKMPGRVVGITADSDGQRGFVLTLQTREQHIRRQKATSNICTNQANCALRAVIYLSLLGKQGLVETAERCAAMAAYAFDTLTAIDGVEPLFQQPFFNEFALRLPCPAAPVAAELLAAGYAAGFPCGRYYEGMEDVLLLACTEKRSKSEIDGLAAALSEALKGGDQ